MSSKKDYEERSYTRKDLIRYAQENDAVKEFANYHEQYVKNGKTQEKRSVTFNLDKVLFDKLNKCLERNHMGKTEFFTMCVREFINMYRYFEYPESNRLLKAICELNTRLNIIYSDTRIDIPQHYREDVDNVINELFDIDATLFNPYKETHDNNDECDEDNDDE